MIEYQDQEQQQQEDVQARPSLHNMTPYEKFGSALIELTDPTIALTRLEDFYRGIRRGKDGEVVSRVEPLMNEEGINSIIGQMVPLTSSSATFSKLTDREIKNIIVDLFGRHINIDLMLNKKKYGIKNYAARHKIFGAALETGFITLKRAMDANEKGFLSKTVQEFRSDVTTQQRNSGGFLSSINPFKKRQG